jgi:hypothetical protein
MEAGISSLSDGHSRGGRCGAGGGGAGGGGAGGGRGGRGGYSPIRSTIWREYWMPAMACAMQPAAATQ